MTSESNRHSELLENRVAVLGAGNGGLTMAGHLAMRGMSVALWNRSSERLEPLKRNKTIRIVTEREGLPSGKGTLSMVTHDIGKAVSKARIIMVVVPATGHADIARWASPFLVDGQYVVLHPGRTGGALEFLSTIRKNGCKADVTVAEAQTLLYACRTENPGQVRIFGIKNSIPVAAIPAHRTPDLVRALSIAYDEFVPGDNVLKTSLDNIGAIFHPAVMVLNAARIESTRGDFEFYIDGISRSVARVLERIDAERIRVGAALGFNCMSAREWLYIAYGAAGSCLFEAIRANDGYYGIRAPHTLDSRYITEDIPASLVPIASLGDEMGIPCPTIRSIIHLAQVINCEDYTMNGRTAESMGVAGIGLQAIRQLILDGIGTGSIGAETAQGKQEAGLGG